MDSILTPVETPVIAEVAQLLWPPGGEELAIAAVVALGLMLFLMCVHVVGAWRR